MKDIFKHSISNAISNASVKSFLSTYRPENLVASFTSGFAKGFAIGTINYFVPLGFGEDFFGALKGFSLCNLGYIASKQITDTSTTNTLTSSVRLTNYTDLYKSDIIKSFTQAGVFYTVDTILDPVYDYLFGSNIEADYA